jgi:hypothetical protein
MKNVPDVSQAKEFHGYLMKWQEILSLGDWRIERVNKIAKDAMASVEFDPPARLASYRLGSFGGEEINSASLEMTALHECLHILLHDLIEATADRNSTEEQREMAEHRVINLLEKLLLKDHHERKTSL